MDENAVGALNEPPLPVRDRPLHRRKGVFIINVVAAQIVVDEIGRRTVRRPPDIEKIFRHPLDRRIFPAPRSRCRKVQLPMASSGRWAAASVPTGTRRSSEGGVLASGSSTPVVEGQDAAPAAGRVAPDHVKVPGQPGQRLMARLPRSPHTSGTRAMTPTSGNKGGGDAGLEGAAGRRRSRRSWLASFTCPIK